MQVITKTRYYRNWVPFEVNLSCASPASPSSLDLSRVVTMKWSSPSWFLLGASLFSTRNNFKVNTVVFEYLMPGNEIEDKIRILYELNNFSLGRHHSQVVDDGRPVLIYDQWVDKEIQIGEPLSFNLKNSTLQQFGKYKIYLWFSFFNFLKEVRNCSRR